MSIHSFIREGRRRLGLSEQQFAERVGVTRGAVQQWEREGGTAPRRANQKAVADLLGVTVAELMGSGDALLLNVDDPLPVDLKGVTTSPTMEWKELPSLKLPPVFKVSVPDESMSPTVRAGQTVELTRGIEPRPGDGVLVRDSVGDHYLRIYRERRKGEWSAHAVNPSFDSMDATAHGLVVVAVVTATSGRWA